MVRFALFVLVAGTAALSATAARAAVPPTADQTVYDSAQISRLVQQLGDASFRAREAATRQLIRVGTPAKAELIAALESQDAEMRYRARLVLADVLELDRQERLRDFIDDALGQREHDLPGWKRYRQQIGETAASRRLFVEMQRSEPLLLEASDMGPEFAAVAFEERCQQIQESMRPPGRGAERPVTAGALAAFLFVGSDNNVPISSQSAAEVTNFCYQRASHQAMGESEASAPLRKLLADWVRRDFGSDSLAVRQTLQMALQLDIREAIEPAQIIIKDADGNAVLRQIAVIVIGRFGSADDIARLEPLLNDESECAKQQIQPNPDPTQVAQGQVAETQLRDVALAVLIRLSGQKLADYGFNRVQENPTYLYQVPTLGFVNAADRDKAISKWRAWRAERP